MLSGCNLQPALNRGRIELMKRIEQMKLQRAGPRTLFGRDFTGNRKERQPCSHRGHAVFLDGERLDPASDSRPDNRPSVREDAPELGDLLSEFDFSQKPNPALVLSPCPAGVDTHYSDAGPCVP